MKPHVKFGLIGAGAIIIWSLIGYVMGNERYETMKYVGWVVMLAVMIYTIRGAILEKRTLQGGFISFGQAFGASALTSLITWIIYSVFSYFYFAFINPEMIDFIKEKSYEEYEKSGMSEEQIEQIVAMSGKWMNPTVMAISSFVMMIIIGLILGLIVAAILKKENPEGNYDTATDKN